MLNIGCHLSSAKGYLHMGKEALAIGANTFQFFTRIPVAVRLKPLIRRILKPCCSYWKSMLLRRCWRMPPIRSIPVQLTLRYVNLPAW